MALDLGSVVATIDLNASGFIGSANKAKTAADSLNGAGAGAMAKAESRLDAFGAKLDAISSKLVGFGTKMTAAVTLPIVGAFAVAYNGAASLEQAMGKTDAVFGDASSSVLQWSEDSAQAFGMSQTETLAAVSTFGSLFNVMGMSNDVSADYSQTLIGLSADMGAFNDVSTERASQAIQAGLTGEYMSLRSMGVFLNENIVSQEAMNIALADGRDEITEADKVQARYNLILEQTGQQQGQFAREADGASGSLAIMKAQIKDVAANFGRLLLPAGTKATRWASDFLRKIDNLSDTQKKWVLGIAGAAAAIGPLALGLGKLIGLFTPLVTIIGFLLSPIGLVVLAIAALAAGAIYAYTHFEPFREAVDKVAAALKDFAENAIEKVVAAWKKLTEAFDADGWSGVWDTIVQAAKDGLKSIVESIRNVDWGAVWDGLVAAAGAAIGWVLDAIRNVDWGALIQGGWNAIYSGLQLAWDAVKDIPWMDIIGKIADFGVWLAGKVSDIPWTTIIGAIADFGVWLAGKVSDIPWSSLIIGTIALSTWLWDRISQYFPSASLITDTIGAFTTWIWGKIYSYFPNSTLITDSIGDFTTWIWGKIDDYFPSADLITGAIGDFGSWLYEKIGAPTLSFPTKDEILNALTFGVLGSSGNESETGQGGKVNMPQTGPSAPGVDDILPFMQPGAMGGSGVFTDLIASINALIAKLGEIPPAFTTAQTGITGFVANTIGVMGGWSTGIQTMLTTVGAAITTRTSTATAAGTASFVAFVSSTIGVMGGWSGGITTMVNTTMSTLQSRVASGTASARSSVTSFVSATIGVMGGWSNGLQTIVSGAMSGMVSRAQSGGQQMASALRNGASQAASAVQGALSRIPGIIASIGGSAAATAYSIGANISNAFASGMYSALGSIQAAASQMVAAADQALRAKARIASPSKVFAALGGYVGEGFTQGIRASIPDAARAAAALVSVPNMGSYGQYGASVPAYAYAPARGTTVTNTYTYGDINITQQPGEDGEALAVRVIGYLNEAERLAPAGGA